MIVPRTAWLGDAPSPRRSPRCGRVERAVIHHTATETRYEPAESAAIVREIYRLHRDVRGWDDIGYNLLVDRHGQVFEGRAGGVERAVVGAHALGHNARSTGIAAIGTYVDEPLPEPGLAALRALVEFKLGLHGVPVRALTVVPHGALAATACPGTALAGQLAEWLTRAPARH